MFLLFNMSNPMLWVLIVAVIFLLFGGSKLRTREGTGQSRRLFRRDIRSRGERTVSEAQDLAVPQSASLSAVDDELCCRTRGGRGCAWRK